MLYYDCKDSGLLVLGIENPAVVVFIFLKNNGLCGRLTDSNYFYTNQSIPSTRGGDNGQSTHMASQILTFVCPPVILFLKN